MFSLLKCEFKKFKGTYINSLSFLGMLSPIILVTLMYLIKREDFIKSGYYNWEKFNEYLVPFFAFMVGPIITSFIAVFSVFYEYHQKTMKNIIASPHGRVKIITAKIIYVSSFVVLQYIVVAIVNVALGLLLGFDMTLDSMVNNSINTIIGGLVTILLVPMMMFITLLFKNFIPAMVITVCGTIANIIMLNWERSYVSPWAIPADIMMIQSSKHFPMKLVYPMTSLCIYLAVFMVITLVYFSKADQHA